ncbi:prefoldin subunit 5 [Nannochloropsis gaditana CCMP526]|uniref:prefoldin subunit 5 n=1 Tax=Nannochloropsis gaditana (strain CCMP526) TaxID=1093141 RepID=UPI00029F6D76|nr:prefoldin subunit 5 [Nannochloropsis gaditana CCMP526]EKU23344.1 prefoldin subunit 5 [Nannochloropsis gaditana CCMP526]|eukprot:XP_005852487.1 prefoldin subunit 5 [Nannochloropsis gaditana CCMP526]
MASVELETITRHYASLREAQSRLNGCRTSVNELAPTKNASVVLPLIPLLPLALGDEILVPLTQSLYVPGTISDADKVLVDVGTGYYIEKTLPKAKEYLEKKIAVINTNAESVAQVLTQKEKSLRMVSGYFQKKLMVMSQTSQARQAQRAAQGMS